MGQRLLASGQVIAKLCNGFVNRKMSIYIFAKLGMNAIFNGLFVQPVKQVASQTDF